MPASSSDVPPGFEQQDEDTRAKRHAAIREQQALEQERMELIVVLRGVVSAAWTEIVGKLRTSGVTVSPFVPDDEREVKLCEVGDTCSRWLTFGTKIEPGPELDRRVAEALAGTDAVIAAEIKRAKALPIVYTRIAPNPFFMADGSVVIRCRLGFGQDPKDEPAVKRSTQADLEHVDLLSEEQIGREEARAREEFKSK